MFLRISTYKVDPSRINEVDAKVDEVRNILDGLPGLKHASVGRDKDGNAAVIALWESEKAATAAEDTVVKGWSTIGPLVKAPPERRGFDTCFHLAGHSF